MENCFFGEPFRFFYLNLLQDVVPTTAPSSRETDPVKRSLDAEVLAIELESSGEATGKASPQVPKTPTALLHTTNVNDPGMSEARRAQLESRVQEALKDSKKKEKTEETEKGKKAVAKATAAKGKANKSKVKGITADVPQSKEIIDENELDPEEEDTSDEEPPTPSESDEERCHFPNR